MFWCGEVLAARCYGLYRQRFLNKTRSPASNYVVLTHLYPQTTEQEKRYAGTHVTKSILLLSEGPIPCSDLRYLQGAAIGCSTRLFGWHLSREDARYNMFQPVRGVPQTPPMKASRASAPNELSES